MLAASLLRKKRDGFALSDAEIRFLVDGFCDGGVADYQMSALAMAICVRGMTPDEVTSLTRAMLESGERLPRRPESPRPRVDKHSTGGLGDKVSLVLAPLLAACDVDVPMISGRGLGITGGTLDKLEAIPGFRTQLSDEQSSQVLEEVGAFIVGASEQIAPADRRLYALRDVTGTVESVPLITASILSKKLAANLDALVMDVKVGSGAFMKTMDQGIELADSIVRVGAEAGLSTSVILSDMDQPLGRTIGNAIEVNEAVEVLSGAGPTDVRDLTIELSANLLMQVGTCESRQHAVTLLNRAIDRGDAMERFQRMVSAQGGVPSFPLPVAPPNVITSARDGYLAGWDCVTIGDAMVAMGGGRRKTGDQIDPQTGMAFHARIGDRIEKGQPILTLHATAEVAQRYLQEIGKSAEMVDHPVAPKALVAHRDQ